MSMHQLILKYRYFYQYKYRGTRYQEPTTNFEASGAGTERI